MKLRLTCATVLAATLGCGALLLAPRARRARRRPVGQTAHRTSTSGGATRQPPTTVMAATGLARPHPRVHAVEEDLRPGVGRHPAADRRRGPGRDQQHPGRRRRRRRLVRRLERSQARQQVHDEHARSPPRTRRSSTRTRCKAIDIDIEHGEINSRQGAQPRDRSPRRGASREPEPRDLRHVRHDAHRSRREGRRDDHLRRVASGSCRRRGR